MSPLLVLLGTALLLIAVFTIILVRRGGRGHINPPSDYYSGDPLIHSPRDVGFRENSGGL